jgi:hypothetical protein
MQIKSETDRLAFDERLAAHLGVGVVKDASTAVLFRESLAVLRPQQLVGVWFQSGERAVPPDCVSGFIRGWAARIPTNESEAIGKTDLSSLVSNAEFRAVCETQLASWIEKLRSAIPRRSLLFAWVYGPSQAVKELVHVRLPSRERRLLIDALLSSLRPRYPWLTNRVICAMAFRPEAFASRRSAPGREKEWGALYHRVAIHRGRKVRYLRIPNPVLKSIQKTLLRLLQPAADPTLGPSVFGARRGIAGPVFANAATHLHRNLIASFDIKDFFPSTTVDDVIRGLQHIAASAPNAVDSSQARLYPAYVVDRNCLRTINWTNDLMVFVARLGTHRGRVPQGSPLSPLLANIAFSPFDVRLGQMLDQEFGRGRVKYSRYFDDLTISALSPNGAEAGMSPSVFLERCQAIITTGLSGSAYRLNVAKSRASTAAAGHDVTGLLVRRNTVSLARRERRSLRTIVHNLRCHDFVQTACRWRQLTGRPDVKCDSIRSGHRFTPNALRRYRMSAERLATLMLRQLYPDLKLRRLLADWHPWQERIDCVDDCISGKKMWPLVEWVLATRWMGIVQPYRPTDSSGRPMLNRLVMRQAGMDVCMLEAESTLDFFFLSRDRAIATTEYWHHLKGMAAYLNGCPEDEAFKQIRAGAETLREAFGAIEIRAATDEPAVIDEPPELPPITTGEHLGRLITEFDQRLRDYLTHAAVQPGAQFGEDRDCFRNVRATDWSTFRRWIQAAHALTTGLCPVLPASGVHDDHIPQNELYPYLRWRSAIDKGLVPSDYKWVSVFEAKQKIGPQTPATHLSRVQGRITESLLEYFRGLHRNRDTASQGGSTVNHWHGEIGERLREQVNLCEELHHKSRSTAAERRLFRCDSWEDFAAMRDDLLQEQSLQMPSTQVWSGLENTAKQMYVTVVEAMEDLVCTETPPDNEPAPEAWKRRQLWKQSQLLIEDGGLLKILDKLRNRAAHGKSPERRAEWVGIQNKVATLLGRSWKSKSGQKHPNYAAPDDLSLTTYEGLVLKLEMLLTVNAWLQRIVETQWWRPRAGSE